jgi:hypothetical protein
MNRVQVRDRVARLMALKEALGALRSRTDSLAKISREVTEFRHRVAAGPSADDYTADGHVRIWLYTQLPEGRWNVEIPSFDNWPEIIAEVKSKLRDWWNDFDRWSGCLTDCDKFIEGPQILLAERWAFKARKALPLDRYIEHTRNGGEVLPCPFLNLFEGGYDPSEWLETLLPEFDERISDVDVLIQHVDAASAPPSLARRKPGRPPENREIAEDVLTEFLRFKSQYKTAGYTKASFENFAYWAEDNTDLPNLSAAEFKKICNSHRRNKSRRKMK